ncbi:AAC(3) family N-acetyltransferase [Luedemannella helvata]|uniref:Aminoglycoside N(3)-acetyltransferase n=1 Tax=Luedemannella helvata TaxID=349315 RepID=A0ABP4X2C1_9ACTN
MYPSVPVTVASLVDDLRGLGVRAGSTLLLHSSLKGIGFVVGGPQAVVHALLDALGPDGTLVVPTHTPDNTDPAGWQHPPVPESWWAPIRSSAPGFDPALTPSRWMGVLAETVRTWPGAVRSAHPCVSFAALGRHAEEITAGHRVDDALGETSPLGAVYRLDGSVLLLGCGHDSNTSLHLAEWRQPDPPRGHRGAAVRRPDGSAEWVTWVDVLENEEVFADLGADLEATGAVTVGRVGLATARLMSQRVAVDFATRWIASHQR